MMIIGYQIRDGNVVVDNYQNGNSLHVKFIITSLHGIAAAAAAITPAPVSTITTAIITATVHGGQGEFDQQQEEEALGDCEYRICV